jgi:protein CpxP
MKAGRSKILAIVLAVTLVGAVAVSQTMVKARHHMGGQGFGLEHMVGMMTDYLDLTDAQQAQVKQIIQNEKPNILPLVQQLHQSQQQLRQLEQSGTFDEAKVRGVASQQAQTMTELTVQKAKIHSEIFNILTPDQKTKATQFLQRREERFQKHMQRMEQGPPAPPAQQ